MFKITAGFNKWTLSAGEAIAFRLLLCDGAGVPEPYDPSRVFVTSISNTARVDMLEVVGAAYAHEDGNTWLEWIISGRESERRYGKQNLRFEIAERLSAGSKWVLEEGDVEIKYSAPSVENYPAAPATRHIIEVKRKIDLATMATPTYDFRPVDYKPPVAAPGTPGAEELDFSDAANSGYIALF